MITLNDLINGTAVDEPDHIQRLFALAEEALTLEGKLEAMDARDVAGGEHRVFHIWKMAAARTGRRVDRLEAAIQNFNDEVFVVEVMIVCGS